MRKIAFFSQKGGCGKTTTCVNIAAALASRGRRILILDLDSNACASRTFGALESLENSIAAALLGLRPLAEVVRPTEIDNIWLVPGATDLHSLDNVEGVLDPNRRDDLGRLSPVALQLELAQSDLARFDYLLLDCPGGHPFIEHLVLLACDEVIIPTGLSIYDLYAATPTMHLILMAREARGDDKPDFLGFLPNGAGRRGVSRRVQSTLDQYSLPCLPAVRHSDLIKTLAGMPTVPQRLMVLARPESAVTASFRQVAAMIDHDPEITGRSESEMVAAAGPSGATSVPADAQSSLPLDSEHLEVVPCAHLGI
ncbi:MAG: ParA family protein [Anaerolineales bacterium]|nr:ParA family protein [Anaerolineales bacterium]